MAGTFVFRTMSAVPLTGATGVNKLGNVDVIYVECPARTAVTRWVHLCPCLKALRKSISFFVLPLRKTAPMDTLQATGAEGKGAPG
jgi:hypothetical protein